jgi:hypothetical protein
VGLYVLGEAEVLALTVTLEQLLEPHVVRIDIAQLVKNATVPDWTFEGASSCCLWDGDRPILILL